MGFYGLNLASCLIIFLIALLLFGPKYLHTILNDLNASLRYLTKYLSISKPLILLPRKAPTPLVIIINKPWALDLIFASVVVSTNNDPEILKKSKAIPYTMHEKMIIHNPSEGFP